MKYTTKDQRILALIHFYYIKHGNQLVTMNEVANWAIQNHLFPVPKTGIRSCEAWELLLDKMMTEAQPCA